MWDERKPDETIEVAVNGYRVVAYSFGTGEETLLCLSGGPGVRCDYLREPHSWVADHGFRVVAFDQLGTGESDRPDDPSLWIISRYVEEVETIRQSLDLGRVHLLGHSWGGWLGIEYGVTYPHNLRTIILANSCADIPHLVTELNRHREALGPETVAMMLHHEAEGTLEHPEYQSAITILNYRHVCRLAEWPAPLMRSLSDKNMGPYVTTQGPNEFFYTGNLKNWNRIPDLHRITSPALIIVGKYDELTPNCAIRMKLALPGAEINVFPNSSHMPFFEEPEAYAQVLMKFLNTHRS